MQEEAFELAELISGYLVCTLTKEQEQRLMFLLDEDKERYKLLEAYKDATQVKERLESMNKLDVDQAWHKINNRFHTSDNPVRPRYAFFKYAAIFLAIVGSLLLYINLKQSDPQIIPDLTKVYKNDVLPASTNAILILSDGKEVQLDERKQLIADKNGITIESNDGKIIYHGLKTKVSDQNQYNTLMVPKAGTYAVTLPDGSRVMLNAMSILKFPVAFSKKERRVELKGEGYFEVSKDPDRPFKVKLEETEVEVLGTHFNVSSYGRIAKTTLLEGSVKVSNANDYGILVPGKQSLADMGNIRITAGNPQQAVAWCKGDFYFNNDEMIDVLTEVGRWYDLKLVYRNPLPKIHISGHVSRKAKLSEVVEMLKDVSNVSFGIEDKNLIIN